MDGIFKADNFDLYVQPRQVNPTWIHTYTSILDFTEYAYYKKCKFVFGKGRGCNAD
jgi:hypothetical protein